MSDTDKLRKNIQKLSAVLDFYNDLKDRRISSKRELDDAKQKLEFAKKQMLKLCLESKKLIKESEKEDIV